MTSKMINRELSLLSSQLKKLKYQFDELAIAPNCDLANFNLRNVTFTGKCNFVYQVDHFIETELGLQLALHFKDINNSTLIRQTEHGFEIVENNGFWIY